MFIDHESAHRTLTLEAEHSDTADNFETMIVREDCTPWSLDRRRSVVGIHRAPFTRHDAEATLVAANHTLRETRQEAIGAPIPLRQRLIPVDSLEPEEVECKILLHPMTALVLDFLAPQILDRTELS